MYVFPGMRRACFSAAAFVRKMILSRWLPRRNSWLQVSFFAIVSPLRSPTRCQNNRWAALRSGGVSYPVAFDSVGVHSQRFMARDTGRHSIIRGQLEQGTVLLFRLFEQVLNRQHRKIEQADREPAPIPHSKAA